MSARIGAHRVMAGTWGELWVGGEKWAEVGGFQAKFSYTKEDVQMAGQMAVDSKLINVKGTGSITLKHVYSRTAGHGDKVLKGIDERLTMIGKLDDPDAFGAERVLLRNVSLDEEVIMDWNIGKLSEKTIPFTFTEREWLEEVNPR